jgi:hypothetical protein
MRVLYINSHSADYVQDLTYSGLVKVLGLKSVVDYHWNQKYHIHYKRYPKDLGFTKGSFFPSILNRNIKDVDAVILGASKVDCFETYIKIVDKISPGIPIIFIDGGDQSEIGRDLTIYERPELFGQAVSKRPFDFIFKREYLLDIKHEKNVYPFPMSYNLDRMPEPLEGKKYDVSFWAVESHPIRTQALKLFENQFDCKRNGTETNQKFRISQKPQILIPNNFRNKESIVFCKDNLSDLVDLCAYYLKHEEERETIAQKSFEHLKKYHTDVVRAEFLLDTVKKNWKK